LEESSVAVVKAVMRVKSKFMINRDRKVEKREYVNQQIFK